MFNHYSNEMYESYIRNKIDQGKIDPDFFSALFVDTDRVMLYDNYAEDKFTEIDDDDLFKVIYDYRKFDYQGYLIMSLDMQHQVNDKIVEILKLEKLSKDLKWI
ncbi:hypothetical protein ACFL1H_06995 [Nanoarchaeota archaeon]